MSRFLITGAFGFVGQWMVKALLDRNEEVIVMSHKNMTLTHNWNLKDVTLVRGDIRNYDFLKKIFYEYRIDTIFHLAAQALVGKALLNPYETMRTNIGGVINLLECAKNYGKTQSIIMASSDKAYGNEKSPYSENTPLNGRAPYDCSKSCGDLVAQCYKDTYDMPISIIRCGNIFGGGDFNWDRVFPEAIKSCFENRAMEIRSDGKSMSRDYIYIEDVISSYLFIHDLRRNEIVNVACGATKNVLDVLRSIQNIADVYIDPNIKNIAQHEIDIQYLDNSYIKSLGWNPKYSFTDGVKKTVGWYYEYFGEAQYD